MTIRGKTGGLLLTDPRYSEGAENYVEALESKPKAKKCLKQTKHVASDDPAKKTLDALRNMSGNGALQMSLDPLHLPFAWESVSVKRPPGSKDIRRVVAKLSAKKPTNCTVPDAFYEGDKIDTSNEDAKKIFRDMTKEKAEKLLPEMDSSVGFVDRQDLVRHLAALVSKFDQIASKKTTSNRKLHDWLLSACAPARLEWLLNWYRFVNLETTMSDPDRQYLATGTAGSEALHSELKNLLVRNTQQLHQATLKLKLRVWQLRKLVSHNSATHYDTTTQLPQHFVVQRVANSLDPWHKKTIDAKPSKVAADLMIGRRETAAKIKTKKNQTRVQKRETKRKNPKKLERTVFTKKKITVAIPLKGQPAAKISPKNAGNQPSRNERSNSETQPATTTRIIAQTTAKKHVAKRKEAAPSSISPRMMNAAKKMKATSVRRSRDKVTKIS